MLFNFRQKEEEKQRKLEEREQLKKYVLPVVLKSSIQFQAERTRETAEGRGARRTQKV